MKIAKITPHKLRSDHLTILLDDGQSFKSHETIAQEHHLAENLEITPDLLEELKLKEELREAREYAILSLNLKDRSVEELTQKLRGRKFSMRAIHILLAELKEKKFLNDAAYAKNYIESNIAGQADEKVREDLLQKGVSEGVIAAALENVEEENKILTEEERAYLLLCKRAAQIRTSDSHTFYRRIYDYLSRRGFEQDTIEGAFRKYNHERGDNDATTE